MKPIAEMSIGELAAFVCSHLQKHGIEVVLTGGGCVEIYSSGKYFSFDLDFIENVPAGGRKLGKVLGEIQFTRKNRYYVHPETEYFLEFPVGPLSVGSEQPFEISVLKYDTGELRALSPTDCVKDRLAAYYHWKDTESLEQALLVSVSSEVNFSEIERWSHSEGCVTEYDHFHNLVQTRIKNSAGK